MFEVRLVPGLFDMRNNSQHIVAPLCCKSHFTWMQDTHENNETTELAAGQIEKKGPLLTVSFHINIIY